MASYKIFLKPSFERDVIGLPHDLAKRVIQQIESLKDNPLPHQSLKLSGAEQLYRIRVGSYRIIYNIDHLKKEIHIQYVRHRRDVYRKR